MENQSESREARRHEIGERIAAIRTRIGDLQQAQREDTHPIVVPEQQLEAQHNAARSRATSQQALASSIAAFQRAAQAHERSAAWHDHAATAREGGNEEYHRAKAAYHRAAAANDRQRAEAARSILSSRAQPGPDDEQ